MKIKIPTLITLLILFTTTISTFTASAASPLEIAKAVATADISEFTVALKLANADLVSAPKKLQLAKEQAKKAKTAKAKAAAKTATEKAATALLQARADVWYFTGKLERAKTALAIAMAPVAYWCWLSDTFQLEAVCVTRGYTYDGVLRNPDGTADNPFAPKPAP